MKTSIIAVMLLLGVLLRPQMTPGALKGAAVNNAPVIVAVNQGQATARALGPAEMRGVVGGGLVGCYEYKGPEGDLYQTCCVNLWFFSVCATINESALGRLISSIF
jgi:tRNA-binding EMAP/Myf-like protein